MENSKTQFSLQKRCRTCGKQARLCAVCGDRPANFHYGAMNCITCRAFFQRSVIIKANYTCVKNKNCVINVQTRNRCKYCRFAKCLLVGMKREAIRLPEFIHSEAPLSTLKIEAFIDEIVRTYDHTFPSDILISNLNHAKEYYRNFLYSIPLLDNCEHSNVNACIESSIILAMIIRESFNRSDETFLLKYDAEICAIREIFVYYLHDDLMMFASLYSCLEVILSRIEIEERQKFHSWDILCFLYRLSKGIELKR
ncbi:unnamed protein product [Dracunculus medinensis]|uniref:Nuclear receptor domain-containing protein n=1 Tax=Dracunculus medinensis TaxID=318479 RepID=A0A0N4UG33_DRAME|nr:unnamed protein product [Dracunculus medinensis]